MERKDNELERFLESHVSSGDTFSNLYPALVECFGIILLGYVAGRYSMQLFFQIFTCVFQLSFCNDTLRRKACKSQLWNDMFYLTLRKLTGIIISCYRLQVSFHQRGRSQGTVYFHRHFLTSCPDLWESHHAGHDHRQLEVPRRNLLRQSNCLPGCSHRHLSDWP